MGRDPRFVAHNISMGCQYFIEVTLIFISDEHSLIKAKAGGK
jgi:hypothetical protein